MGARQCEGKDLEVRMYSAGRRSQKGPKWLVKEERHGYGSGVSQEEDRPRPTPRSGPVDPEPAPAPDHVFMIGERIADLSARINVAEYEMLTLIAEFDDRRGWAVDGFGSCAEWLAWRIGVKPVTARERVRAALALRNLPETSQAMKSGELSFSKVRALTRVASAKSEGALLELAQAGSAANLERVVRSWKHLSQKAELSLEQRRHKNRRLSIFIDEDGMYVVKGRLTPEVGALLMRAVEAASDELFRREDAVGDVESRAQPSDLRAEPSAAATVDPAANPTVDAPVDPAQRRADAIGILAELALGRVESMRDDKSGRGFSGTRAERYQVMVHVGVEALVDGASGGAGGTGGSPASSNSSHAHRSEIDGVRVSAVTSRRLCCDAGLVRIGHGTTGEILDIGRRTRPIPGAIHRALESRDGGCRFPGCGSRFTAGHHVEHWVDGGSTSLKNLILLCPRHHTAVHEGGVRVVMEGDGTAQFFTPDGRWLAAAPVPRVGGSVGLPHLEDPTEVHLRVPRRTGGAPYKRDCWIPPEVEGRARDALG